MPVITSFDMNLGDLPASGETRPFSVVGEQGCIFSLEIINEDGYYYNFDTETFAAAKTGLKNKRISNRGVYQGSIAFPSVGDDDDYDIYLWAHPNWGTVHEAYQEARFLDGTLNINASSGSNSALVQKILYQYTDTTVTLDARSPNYLTAWASVAISGNRTLTVPRGKNSGKIPFSVIVTTAATKALQIDRQPESNDIYAFEQISMGTGQQIPGEDIWAGTTASGAVKGTVTGGNGGSSGVNITLSTTLASAFTDYGPVGYRVTGTSTDDELNTKVITIVSYTSGGPSIELSEAVAVSNGTTLTLTAPQYYRWSVKSDSSMHKLRPGMKLNFATGSTDDYSWGTRPATIKSYVDTTSYSLSNFTVDGEIEEETRTTINQNIPALDALGYKPTITNGVITKQLGNITFDRQVNEDATNRAVWLYAYGEEFMSAVNSADIVFSDLKVEITKPTTATTGAVSDSTTIGVTDREGTIQNVSIINGINIGANHGTDTVDGDFRAGTTKIVLDNNVAGQIKAGDRVTGISIPKSSFVKVVALNPDGDNVKEFSVSETVSIADGATLTFIPQSLPAITSSTADGAGNWTVDVPQTLESGAILTVENTSRIATITGNIEVNNLQSSDFTLYFDLETFLTAV